MAEFKRIEVTDPAHADVVNEKIVEPAIELEQKVNKNAEDIAAVDQKVNAHLADKANPHGVTAEQIGAETPSGAQAKADQAEQNAKNYTDEQIANIEIPEPPVTSVNGKTGEVTITKVDVGLGNVDNVKQASKAEFDAHLADYTQLKTNTENHVNNSDIHVTLQEKQKWDNKQDALPAERIRKITFGTTEPSGGSDGDIYFQYE